MTRLEPALPRGLLVVQLDGVSFEALRRGLRRGPMPTVAGLIEERSHELLSWRAGVPAQTASSQAAILYGNDFDIPSFRWYEKERGRLMVSNHPGDAAEIDRRACRNGGLLPGLLAHNGSSVGNLVSGGAPRSILTMGTLTSEVRSTELYRLLLDPRFMGPEILKMAREFALEVGQGTRQKVRLTRPRVRRGGSFPFLRAISNVLVRDLTTRIVRTDLAAGVPVIYATYVGYDVVAHHAGPFTGDALRVLGKLDREVLRLVRASRRSPRTYDLVLLSDHGQTPGAPFRQRFGIRLEDLVRRLAAGRTVSTGGGTTETWGYLNQILSGAVQGEGRGPRRARRALAPRLRDGYVEIGPDRYAARSERSQVIVANSGNLAHVYLARLPGRLSLGEVRAAVPGLIEGLVDHAGIDFVMGRHPDGGGLVLGKRGIHDLTSGQVEGEDPLRKFGPDASASLQRLNEFPHAGDLVLNSRFDPANETIAAFEEMVGSHGGLGGPQNDPFLLVPRDWDPADVTAGGRAIHDLLAAHVPAE